MNNTTLAYYDFATGELDNDLFLTQNGRGLGDTGSDLARYGDKLYCVVNISETVEVMNKQGRSIKQISLPGKQPRKIAFYEASAYVCCYDGDVVRIDTSSLEIVGTAQAGSNPDGICVAGGKLYVSNSGGLNYPNYGNTVSVFDATTLTHLKEIPVVINPTKIAADTYGDVYVVSNGNYDDVPMTFQRIDTQSDEVAQTFSFPVTNFAIAGDRAYLYDFNYNTQTSSIKVLNVITEVIEQEQFIKDGTTLQTPYGIAVNPSNGDVYLTDAYQYTTNGTVYCFGSDGRKKFQFDVGINPCVVIAK